MKNYGVNVEQLKLSLMKEEEEQHIPAKRVDIVSLRFVKERSLLYKIVQFVVLKMATICLNSS